MPFKYSFPFMCVVLFASVAVALPINDDRPIGDDDATAAAASSAEQLDNSISQSHAPIPSTMSLPSNATAIRPDITDTFSCDGKIYGYYADVENDCQIFHICLPVTYADGKENMFRWSFVCPDETIFSQELFTCIRPADWNSDCADSSKFVALNRQFGASPVADEEVADDTPAEAEDTPAVAEDTPAVAIETKQLPIDVTVKPAAAPIVPIYVRPLPPAATEELISVVEKQAENENDIISNVKSILQTVDENVVDEKIAEKIADDKVAVAVPVYDDAETSESQSFGLVKVTDDNTFAVAATEASQDIVTEESPIDESIAQIAEIVSVVSNALQQQSTIGDDVALPAAAVEAVTEHSDEAIAPEDESTELWNHSATQSLYDGGSTVDDNVEVNAILDTESLAVTEALATR